jgi:Spy/CpxP family protein refolding chaperone
MKFSLTAISSSILTSLVIAMPSFAQESILKEANEAASASIGSIEQVEPIEQMAQVDQFDIAIAPMEMQTIAFSPAMSHSIGGHCGFMGMLDLSDEQMEKMVALKDKYCLDVASKKAELKSLFHQMMNTMTEAKVDKKQAGDLHKKIATIKSDLSDLRFDYTLQAAELLTEEQRKIARHAMLSHQLMGGFGFGHSKRHHHGSHHSMSK